MSEQIQDIDTNYQIQYDSKTFQMFVQKFENILNQHQSELTLSKQETQVFETKTELSIANLKREIIKLKDKMRHIYLMEQSQQSPQKFQDSRAEIISQQNSFDFDNYGDLLVKVEKLDKQLKKYSNRVERQSEKQTILQNFIRDKEVRNLIISVSKEMCEEIVFTQIGELKLNIDQKIQAQMSCVDNVTRAMRRLDNLLEQQRNQMLIFKDELVNSLQTNMTRVDKVNEHFQDVKQSIKLKLNSFDQNIQQKLQMISEFNELNIPGQLETLRNYNNEQTSILEEKIMETKSTITIYESMQNSKKQFLKVDQIRKDFQEKIDQFNSESQLKFTELKNCLAKQNLGNLGQRISKAVKQLQDKPTTKPEESSLKNNSSKTQDSKSNDTIQTSTMRPKNQQSKPKTIDMAYLNKLGNMMESMIKLFNEAKNTLDLTKYKFDRKSEDCIPEYIEQPQDNETKYFFRCSKSNIIHRRKSVRIAHQAHQIRMYEGQLQQNEQEFNDKEINRKLSPAASSSPVKSIHVVGHVKDISSRRSKAFTPARTYRIESLHQEINNLFAQSEKDSLNPFHFAWNENKNSSVFSTKSHF